MLLALLAFVPAPAWPHAGDRSLVLLLPTEYYFVGGAFAVAASFVLLAFLPPTSLDRVFRQRLSLAYLPRLSPVPFSVASFLFLVFLLTCGVYGSRDPLANPLPLFLWTLWWIGFTVLQALVGNLWVFLNPWTGPMAILRHVTAGRLGDRGLLALPKCLGYAPAIVIFLGFAWFELIDLAPSDPSRLAVVVASYWLGTVTAMVLFGEQAWASRGEAFSIFFSVVSSLSPFLWSSEPQGQARLSLVWPGHALLSRSPLPLSGVAFILLTLSTVSFDGFSRTFTWLALIDINPLEFPGRSAVELVNSIGLVVAFVILSGGFFATVAAGTISIRRPDLTLPITGLLIYSIVPISISFHTAHYLVNLMTDGQFAVAAFSDPFQRGMDLVGFTSRDVTTSFLKNLDDVTLIWRVQTTIICAGHVIGIVVAHMIALRSLPTLHEAVTSQAGLASLMVLYTVFGLWLLATPTGA